MERKDVIVIIVAILVGLVIGLSIGNVMFHPIFGSCPYMPTSFEYKSNGERIFMTGINENGERISFTAGPQWLYMHGGGCASCHGVDGRGGIYPMMCNIKSPDIRYSTLTKHGMSEEDIKRAITNGIDEDGEKLDYCMPRWHMSEKDLNDLIEYLKQL